MIYIGTPKLKQLYAGVSKAKKIYLDELIVWQSAIPVQKPSETSVSRSYNGSVQNNGYTCPSGVTMTGTASAIDGGVYTATYTPDADHEWSDGTRNTVTVTLTISYVWNVYGVNSTIGSQYYDDYWHSWVYNYGGRDDMYITEFFGTSQAVFDTTNGEFIINDRSSSSPMVSVKRIINIKNSQRDVYPYYCVSEPHLNGEYENRHVSSYFNISSSTTYWDDWQLFAKGTKYYAVRTRGTYQNQVSSLDQNTYPQDGISNNLWYTKTW